MKRQSEPVGKELTGDEKEALRVYLENFGDCRDGTAPGVSYTCLAALAPGYNRKAFPWYTAPAQQPKHEELADVRAS